MSFRSNKDLFNQSAELKRHAMWPRLSLQDRERRAEGNVYPQDLLSEREKEMLRAGSLTNVIRERKGRRASS